MSVTLGQHSKELQAFLQRDSLEGRFLRYARARVRQFFVRQLMTALGVVTLGLLIDWRFGAALLVIALMGELADVATLAWLWRKAEKGTLRKKFWMSSMSAGFQAACFSTCIILSWMVGGKEVHFFCLAFYAATAMNAGIVTNFNKPAAFARMGVYAISTVGLLVGEGLVVGSQNLGWQMDTLATLILAVTVFFYLKFMLSVQSRHMQGEGELLTEKARVEEALQTKTRFLSSVSHQLRTPLNGIMGASDLLAHNKPRADQIALLQPLRSSATDLHALISDILDITQMEKGGLMIKRNVVDIEALLSDTAERYRNRAEEKHLNFTIRFDGTLPRQVLADADRIKQILSKLLANAVKYTEHGGIEMAVSLGKVSRQSFAFVNITDTGPGMSQKQLKRLFSDTPSQGDALDNGLGLGMRISQKLARQMGGNLTIESERGAGTTCRLMIELQASGAEEKQLDDWNISDAAILVAEDNRTNQLIVKKMLASTGASLCFANDGVEAVDKFHSFHPDLILMDLAMPNKTGLEATKDIRRFEEKSHKQQTPIIALTANAFEEDRQSCERVGMNGFLSKPVSREALINELTRAGQASLG